MVNQAAPWECVRLAAAFLTSPCPVLWHQIGERLRTALLCASSAHSASLRYLFLSFVMSLLLYFCFYVLEYSHMYLVDDVIRPQIPILRRPDRMPIPGRPFEPRPPAGQRRQQKLPLLGNKVPVQMRRLNFPVRTKFVQRRRISRHPKFQEPRLVPYFDRLDEWPRRKIAMPHRTNAMPGNLRPNRIRNPRPKQQFLRRRYLRKRHHLDPNFLGWRVHVNRGSHLKSFRLRIHPAFRSLQPRLKQENDPQHPENPFLPPRP